MRLLLRCALLLLLLLCIACVCGVGCGVCVIIVDGVDSSSVASYVLMLRSWTLFCLGVCYGCCRCGVG